MHTIEYIYNRYFLRKIISNNHLDITEHTQKKQKKIQVQL